MLFAAVHESAFVQVFGRRDDDAIHVRERPAAEKRQCRKSRDVVYRLCRGRYGDLATEHSI